MPGYPPYPLVSFVHDASEYWLAPAYTKTVDEEGAGAVADGEVVEREAEGEVVLRKAEGEEVGREATGEVVDRKPDGEVIGEATGEVTGDVDPPNMMYELLCTQLPEVPELTVGSPEQSVLV